MTPRRLRGAPWVGLGVLAYAAALVVLGPPVGTPIMALSLVPAALAGWYFGALGGGLVALGLIAVNAVLGTIGGAPDGFAVSAGAVPSDLLAISSGLVLGALRTSHAEASALRREAMERLEESEELAAALGATEQRFRLLTEEALVGVYLIEDGKLQYVNQAFASIFGYEPTEIIGRLGPEDVTLPDDLPIVQRHIQDRLEHRSGVAHYRFRGIRKDGSTVMIEALGRVVDTDGRPAILGTLLDLTRQAEDGAALRLRLTALEAAPAGIVIADNEAVIQWANPHAEQLTGYRLDELVGAHTRLFNSGQQSAEFYRTMWDTISSGEVWHGELVNRRKDGSEYLEAMSITPVRGDHGTIEHFVAVKQDVTQQRADEDAIRALNASLGIQLNRLMTLRTIDGAITDGLPLEEALAVFVGAARGGLPADGICVFLPAPGGSGLELAATDGLHAVPPRVVLDSGQGLAGRVAADHEVRVVHGRDEILAELPPALRSSFDQANFNVLAAAPMTVRGTQRGVLVAAHRNLVEHSEEWLSYFHAVATQGAILVDNAGLLADLVARNAELQAAYEATIEGWSRALDLRDRETEGHSRRVTDLALALARRMGMSADQLVHLRRGALLHDIGKMGIPDRILQKPGPLDDDEWAVMKSHTQLARDLLAPIAFLGPALEVPCSHHERWDGSGYPEGWKGEAIPRPARIFAVADVYDALTSDRPYRPAWTHAQAAAHIAAGAGTEFDPEVVEAFLALQGEASGDPPPPDDVSV